MKMQRQYLKSTLTSLTFAFALLGSCPLQANIVGYTLHTFYPGGNLFHVTLYPLNGADFHISYLIPSMADGASISLWDPATQTFSQTSVYSQSTGWSVDLELPFGVGALLNTPTEYTAAFVGELRNREGNPTWGDDALLPAPLFTGPNGLYLLGDKFLLESSGQDVFLYVVGREATVGEQVIRLDAVSQSFIVSTLLPNGEWDVIPTLGIDEAVFFNIGPVETPFSLRAEAGPSQVVEQTTCDGASVTLDGTGSTSHGGNLATYHWTWGSGSADGANPTVWLPPGQTSVTLLVDNGFSLMEDTVTIKVQDTMAPLLTCPASITKASDPGMCSVVVTYEVPVSDACLVTTSVFPPSGSTFPKGVTLVNCSATDAAGNESTCAFTVTVEDKEAPQVSVQSVTATSQSQEALQMGPMASSKKTDNRYQLLANDNCDAAPKIYVKDSASEGIAGPYASGDIVRITQGNRMRISGGTGTTLAQIVVKGDALIYSIDADGNTSTSLVLKPR